jgi:CRP-like cAMP-binding protein
MQPTNAFSPTSNRLLSTLPPKELDRLWRSSEVITFDRGSTLFHAGERIDRCYFPLNGMISLLSVSTSGRSVEVGYIGYEGYVGFSLILGSDEMPYEALAQSRATCLVLKSSSVTEMFDSCDRFQKGTLRFSYVMIRQLTQSCLCNHFHTVESRFCRWLSVMSERSRNSHMQLTQEFLAMMLGVQRTSIGPVTAGMQRQGIIRYSRGLIEILDQKRLKQQACECYTVVNHEYADLIADLDGI